MNLIHPQSIHQHFLIPTMSLYSLPTFPSLITCHSIQPTLPITSPSKFGANLIHRDASVAATGNGKVLPFVKSENGVEDMRRKRRRKRIEVSNQRKRKHEGNSAISKRLVLEREWKTRLMRDYMGLVVWVAAKYKDRGMSMEDLVQEGIIGLFRAAEKFDPDRGCKLSTYAYWWIKQAILKTLAENSRVIRIPEHMHKMIAKVEKTYTVLRLRLGREPTYDEIAKALDVNVSTVQLVYELRRQPVSLDQPISYQKALEMNILGLDEMFLEELDEMTSEGIISGSDGIILSEYIPGPVEMNPEKMFEREQVKQGVVKLLSTLNKREEEIVRLHYGLSREAPLPLATIGERFKLSRERVRQIHRKALLKLQENTLVDSLKYYVV